MGIVRIVSPAIEWVAPPLATASSFSCMEIGHSSSRPRWSDIDHVKLKTFRSMGSGLDTPVRILLDICIWIYRGTASSGEVSFELSFGGLALLVLAHFATFYMGVCPHKVGLNRGPPDLLNIARCPLLNVVPWS